MENRSYSKYIFILLFILLIAGVGILMKSFVSTNEDKVSTETKKSIGTTVPTKSDFSLLSSSYNPESVSIISNFEAKEEAAWQGSGVIEDKIFFEGASSLGLVSTDRRQSSVVLEKAFDLSKMEFIEFMVHITDTETYESVTLDFGETSFNSYYRYSLTNLKNGWNLIQIPKDKFILNKPQDSVFDWSQVQKIRFLSMSRPSSIFLMRIDTLRSINDSNNYLKNWRSLKGDSFFSLVSLNGKTQLMARNMGVSTASLKDVEDINDFMFVSSVSPQTTGRTGLFIRGNYDNGYGYYFLIGGDKRNTWEIQKKNKFGWTKAEDKIQGVLQNVVFSKDKKYWLRAEAKSDVMEFYFSFDGQKFEKLGEIVDSEFRGGGVGITAFDTGSWSLFDDFHFKRY